MTSAPSYAHDLFADDALREPNGHYAALRALGPVAWLEASEIFAVSHYAEARAVLSDADTYCSGQGVALNDVANGAAAGRNLIMTDGELHSHLRKVLARGLTPRAIRHLDENVRVLADELVRSLVDAETFDAVADLARALPLTIVPDLIGWPSDGRDHLLEWASAMFDWLGPPNERFEQATPKTQAMMAFTAATAASGNLMSGSVAAGVLEAARNGDIEPDRVAPLLIGYMAPSLDTTISAIGSAAWLFATHPAQWDAVRADPSLIPNAFNEVVRIESPIRAFARVTTTCATIGGVSIAEGSRLVVLFGAANRDERHFERPDQFDVRRVNSGEQLGFGFGSHSCAGQGLARMESHAVLASLAARVDRMELDGTPERALNNLINAWGHLPVKVHAA